MQLLRGSTVLILGGTCGCYFFSMVTSGCLVEGTRIATPGGARRVEALRVGDEVWSRAEDGRTRIGQIVAIRRHLSRNWLRITFEMGDVLDVTAEHPIATVTGWAKAHDLREGNRVLTLDGEAHVIAIEQIADSRPTFDLEIAPYSNFFANRILLHNKSPATHFGYWHGKSEAGEIRIEIRRFGKGLATVGARVFLTTTSTPAGFRWRAFSMTLGQLGHGSEGFSLECEFARDYEHIAVTVFDPHGMLVDRLELSKDPESTLRALRGREPYASALAATDQAPQERPSK